MNKRGKYLGFNAMFVVVLALVLAFMPTTSVSADYEDDEDIRGGYTLNEIREMLQRGDVYGYKRVYDDPYEGPTTYRLSQEESIATFGEPTAPGIQVFNNFDYPIRTILGEGRLDSESIVIVLLGDGFLAGNGFGQIGYYQNPGVGTFLHSAHEFAASLTAMHPFSLFSDYFKIYAVETPSTQGIRTGSSNNPINAPHPGTYFGTYISRNQGVSMVRERRPHAVNIANWVSSEVIMTQMIMNTRRFGGVAFITGASYRNRNSLGVSTRYVSNTPERFPRPIYHSIIIHEIGHNFGGLRDENLSGTSTSRANAAISTYTDDQLKWGHWLGHAGISRQPASAPPVRIHPTENRNCLMRNTGRPEFCAVCSAELTRRMALISGDVFEVGRRPNGRFRSPTPNVIVSSQHNRILPYAFHGNRSLNTITIAASVNSIGDFAFIGASGLQKITNYSIIPQQINDTTFAGLNRADITVRIPLRTRQAYIDAGWHGFVLIEYATSRIVSCEVSLRAAVADAGSETTIIHFTNDITLEIREPLRIPANADIILSSSGEAAYSLIASGNFDVISTASDAVLTINGINITRQADTNGRGIINHGYLTLIDGTIRDHNTTQNGGGVMNRATFIMEGGAIYGNRADRGGGVDNTSIGATFIMRGGVVENNNATASGGGVRIWDRTHFYMEGGKITSNTTSVSGGGILNDGIFNMTGGIISDNTAIRDGGGMENRGIFNMVDGKITGNTTNANGGGMLNNGMFNMTDGVISYNTAVQNGGGLENRAIFEMTGGVISSNTAGIHGGGIATSRTNLRAGNLRIGINAIFENNKAQTVRIPTNDSDITAFNRHIHATQWTFCAGFGGLNNYDIQATGTIIPTPTLPSRVSCEVSLREAVAAAANGYATTIYLINDITLQIYQEPLQISSGANVTLRSSGRNTYTLIANGRFDVVNVLQDAQLFINGINISRQAGTNGRGVINHGYLTLIDGTIRDHSTTQNGGGVMNRATFIMEGGAIYGNRADRGGGVDNTSIGATFIMRGGVVENNNATASGGGVRIWDRTHFYMEGGKITSNTTSVSGGGILNDGIFNMTGGIISDNTAVRDGGGMENRGIFNMVDGKITGNTTNANGGGMLNNGMFNMTDGVISYNTAVQNGGGLENRAIFEMTGGVISSNTAGIHGGGIATSRTNLRAGNLRIGINAIFENNKAQTARIPTNDSDITAFNRHIHATQWTFCAGFGGLNNYDIQATGIIISVSTPSSRVSCEASLRDAVIEAGSTPTTIYFLDNIVLAIQEPLLLSTNANITLSSSGETTYTLTANGSFDAIFVSQDAWLNIDGINITRRAGTNGRGVTNRGTLTLTDGAIKGHNTTLRGGGVENRGTFIMEGGAIYGNNADRSGGVDNTGAGATFIMRGGVIESNHAIASGGGVRTWTMTSFYMEGGKIVNNTTRTDGAGLLNEGVFNMTGGAIIGNNARQDGGGIENRGIIIIESGEISSNIAGRNGGGIAISSTNLRAGHLYIGADVIFANNRARDARISTSSADIAAYNQHIHASQWSLINHPHGGLNNFDIQTGGTVIPNPLSIQLDDIILPELEDCDEYELDQEDDDYTDEYEADQDDDDYTDEYEANRDNTNDEETHNQDENDAVTYITITWYANDGTGDVITQLIAYGSTIYNLPSPTKYGYEFIGWFTIEGAQITTYTITPNYNITFWAKWMPALPYVPEVDDIEREEYLCCYKYEDIDNEAF